MSGKLSSGAQLRVLAIADFLTKVQHLHSQVEQYATARLNPDMYEMPVRRTFQQLKLSFMGAGFDALSQLCASLDMAIRRGGSHATKSRILREGVGSIRFQLEFASRMTIAEDQQIQQRAADEKALDA